MPLTALSLGYEIHRHKKGKLNDKGEETVANNDESRSVRGRASSRSSGIVSSDTSSVGSHHRSRGRKRRRHRKRSRSLSTDSDESNGRPCSKCRRRMRRKRKHKERRRRKASKASARKIRRSSYSDDETSESDDKVLKAKEKSRSRSRSRERQKSATPENDEKSQPQSRSRSPSIPLDPRRRSPSHLEARRITSARKRPIPYDRKWISDSDSSANDVSSGEEYATRGRSYRSSSSSTHRKNDYSPYSSDSSFRSDYS